METAVAGTSTTVFGGTELFTGLKHDATLRNDVPPRLLDNHGLRQRHWVTLARDYLAGRNGVPAVSSGSFVGAAARLSNRSKEKAARHGVRLSQPPGGI